jgi:NAD(P)-dependent dehydrogenase (short-subunit alcohol dehydrogenase family)
MSTAAAAQANRGRVVLVSGGGGGIGSAICMRLGLLGFSVAVCDVDATSAERTAQVLRSNGAADAHAFVANVADEHSVTELVARVVARFGALHAAVNNAGVIGKVGFGKIEHWTADEYDNAMHVNARGVFLAMKAQILQFRRQIAAASADPTAPQPQYSIVNVSSLVGLKPGQGAGQIGYAASKAAVVAMTQTAAVEYADKGLRINCVCPSIIASGMGAALPEMTAELVKRNNPAKRAGTAFEVVNAIEFLLDARSTFINGVALAVDGGQAAK